MPARPYEAIPKVPGLPLLGSALALLRRPLPFFQGVVETYGRLNRVRIANREVVCIHDAEGLEQMLLRDAASYNKSERMETSLHPLLGRSVATTVDLAYWAQLRQQLQPLFTPKMLRSYFEGTVDAVLLELDQLEEARRSGAVVELNDFIRAGVFHALTRTLFTRGIDVHEIPELMRRYTEITPYISARYLLGENPLVELMPAARRGRKALAHVNARIDDLINERRADPPAEPEDMLDVIMLARGDDGAPLSHEAIRHNVMTMFFGGQETTPGTIMWAFGLLAAHPDKRRKLLDEVDTVLAGQRPTFESLALLEYTGMVIDETLRLYPMFPYLERWAVQDTELDGYAIRAGTSMFIVAGTTHRDPRYWPDPDAFIPERHSKEAQKARPRCAMVPFGFGQRRCIGERVGRLEAMLTLVMVSQRFLLEHEGGALPETEMVMSPKPRGGMPMRVVAR